MRLKSIASILLAFITTISGFSALTFADEKVLAFPGAEGGGMYTRGARASSNMEVYHVTNLNDTGVGSFRHAVSRGNRIIVFDVAGNIMLKSQLRIGVSNLTILGQTAPGEGICIGGESVRFTGCNEVIIRYLRFRMGDNSTSQEDALGVRKGENIIIDHCSISWSVDECLSMYENMNTTVQNCIISESLNYSGHDKGAHGYGGIWGGANASFHHNLLSTHNSRNPRIGTNNSYVARPDYQNLIDIRNNVIYNWGNYSAYGGESFTRVNIINNYYKPTKIAKHSNFYKMYGNGKNESTVLYIDGNVYENNPTLTNDNWAGVDTAVSYNYVKCENISDGYRDAENILWANNQYIAEYPITTTDAETAYNDVLNDVGANIYQDSIDKRVIDNVKNGTMPKGSVSGEGLIDSQNDVGSWVSLYGTKKTDSDNDGMPDEYELSNGLDINRDDSLDINANGYTNIENYANYMATTTYSGYEVNSSLLKSQLDTVLKLKEANYNPDDWAKIMEAYEKAKTVYYLSEPTQEQIDLEYDNLKTVVESIIGTPYEILMNAVNDGKAVEIYKYSYDSLNILINTIVKAEKDIEENNVDNYEADTADIKAAINNLKEYSLRINIKKAIDFAEEMDLSHLLFSDRVKIKEIIADAKAVINNPESQNDDITNSGNNLKSIINGNYRRIDNGKIVELCDFKDGNIDNTGFITENPVDIQIIDGYSTNNSKVLSIIPNGNNMGENNSCTKQTDFMNNCNHFMLSFDLETPKYCGCGIKIWNSKDDYYNRYIFGITGTYFDQYVSFSKGENYSDAQKFFVDTTRVWATYSIEVDKNIGSVIYYINNIPIVKAAYNPNSNFDSYGIEFCNMKTRKYYLDNITLTDLSDDRIFVVGDADFNGKLDVNDVSHLMQSILLDKESEMVVQNDKYGFKFIDLNEDGVINSVDAAMVLQKVLDSSYMTPADDLTTTTTESTTITESTTETTTATTTTETTITTETTTTTTTESTTTTTTESTTETTTTETTTELVTIDYQFDGGNIKFDAINGIIVECSPTLNDLVIPDTIEGVSVKSIDIAASRGLLSNVESITFPNSLEKIYDNCFENLKNLKTVNFNEGLKEIGYGAFAVCDNLVSVTLPESLEVLGHSAFDSCNNLESVIINSTNLIVERSAFCRNPSLKYVKLSSGVKTIGERMFDTCKSLEEIEIPEGVEKIEKRAFTGCGIKYITIPNSVVEIDSFIFSLDAQPVIRCYEGSVAQKYAIDNNIKYEIIQ